MNAPQRFTPDPLVEAALEFAERLKIDVPWETIAQGQIIMNPPVGFLHADRADKIGTAIKANLPGWSVWPELGLHTADGVKSPELSAAPPGFEVVADSRGFLLRASVLCVEIMSPTNSWAEMQHKTLLYLAAGAKEVWICEQDGGMHFFDSSGEMAQSALVPTMPARVEA
jgi:Uma2 family endonuclease